MSDTAYYFMPAVRQGLAAQINKSANGTQRAGVDVTLKVGVHAKGQDVAQEVDLGPQPVKLYGPGDVVGFDDRIISRCYPEPDVGDFEPNYFPLVEFTDADFVWRLTANLPEQLADCDGDGADDAEPAVKLDPWVTLIVLKAEDGAKEFEEGERQEQHLSRHIVVTDTTALPKPEFAWRWAHVHITGNEGLTQDELQAILENEPERAVCRLVCPRRLEPKIKYRAFIVPTFELGRRAGLGMELDSSIDALQYAWSVPDSDSDHTPSLPEFPYYYQWEFRTGMRGDFEHQIRMLQPRKLSELGVKEIDCSDAGFGMPGVDEPEAHYLGMEGALRSLDTHFTDWGQDPLTLPTEPGRTPNQAQQKLAELINRPSVDMEVDELVYDLPETNGISEIDIKPMASGTAIIVSWDTVKRSICHIDYRNPDGVENFKETPAYNTTHSLTLARDLIPGETHRILIIAEAEDGTITRTAGSFNMLPLPSVVPPMYGRWHQGKHAVSIAAEDQKTWFEHLNLDPRHRAAAGLGAEVIRKQQESLMASAWDQLGAIESANDILRRAQCGREISLSLYSRLNNLSTEDFLRLTSPVQKRILMDEPESDQRRTVRHVLRSNTRIPAAALDPAFRRIARARGPIRKRQKIGRRVDMLRRLASGDLEAAGPPPKPSGTTSLCDITRNLLDSLAGGISTPAPEPTLLFFPDRTDVALGESVTLMWRSTGADICMASGDWTGPRPPNGRETVGPINRPMSYTLNSYGEGGHATASVALKPSGEPVAPPGDTPTPPGGGGKDCCDEGSCRVSPHEYFRTVGRAG